ncbi:MAG: FMN-binding protein [Lacipirellulaceae bacterium]
MTSSGSHPRRIAHLGSPLRKYVLHATRVAIFIAIIWLIHDRHQRHMENVAGEAAIPLDHLQEYFPQGVMVAADAEGSSLHSVILDENGEIVGRFFETSPEGDDIIGFSGPTNALVAFDAEGKICDVSILSSQDTRDHVNQVKNDEHFLKSFNGMTREEAAQSTEVDSVSGATLTALAIRQAIIKRLGGGQRSLKFPEPLSVKDVRPFFPEAISVSVDEASRVWEVKNDHGDTLGTVLRTADAAENIIGYQGPSDSLIGLSTEGKVIGLAIRKSYDNQPYVDYVREDRKFPKAFLGRTRVELAELNLEEAGVEGVSGATMTSMAVAEGLIAAAKHREQPGGGADAQPTWRQSPSLHDYGTALTIALGMAIGLTSLRANRKLRIGFQIFLIVYLGLIAGNLVSQAMLVGWAQNGVPWRSAIGLALLAVAAFILPITTKRNLYCSHLCPHGAAQELLKRRGFRQVKLPAKLKVVLKLLPALLLLWCLLVGMTAIGFSLVDIEPFDAYVWKIAGTATIVVAIVGLVASLFVPMAYCHYGCPTGALLNYFRFNARSDRWTNRDWAALSFLIIACVLWAR